MQNFKDWFYSEETGPGVAGPTPQMQSNNPTADKQYLTKAVQGTMQDPQINPLINSKITNPAQMQQKIMPIAQNFLKRNPNMTSVAPITPMDISKQITPQLNTPGMQQQRQPGV